MLILLASMLARYDASTDVNPWPMVRAAAADVVRSGRVTPEDRWEEEGSYSP
jgi:glucoamylase